MRPERARRLAGSLVAMVGLAFAGCSFIAPHRPPAAPVAESFPTYPNAPAEPAGPPAAEIAWQDFLAEPRLRHLVEISLTSNRDLKLAALNIDRARALYQIQRADLLPTVNASAGRTDQRVSGAVTPTGNGYEIGYYTVGVGITAWEADFFGRVRALGEAALAGYLATEEARRATQIGLVASVANAYLAMRADDELIDLTRQTVASRERSVELARVRAQAGVINEVDWRVAQGLLAAARASLAQFERQRMLDENALVLLIGRPLPADLPAGTPFASQALADVPAGLPSDLLARRPDIRGAEQQLIAAEANLGAARAAMFPRISLTASFGAASDDLTGLLSLKSRAWSLIPGVSLPIFDSGRNRANLEVAGVNREIALAQYEKAIQSAFREVADALAARAALGQQLAALTSQQKAEQARAGLVDARYRGGVATALDVLDAERSVFAVRQSVILAQLQRLQSQVNLYKALGGGWKPGKDDPPPTARVSTN